MRLFLLTSFCVAFSLCSCVVEAESIVISGQNPDHYWTFDGNTTDTGDTGGANGTLNGNAATNGASLLLDNTGSALSLDGSTASGGSEMQIPDAETINMTAADDKTISFAFQAAAITTTRGVVWEHGGNTRGISIYVLEVGGEDRLYMAAWNQAESDWGSPPVHVFTPITEGTTYHAAMVLVGDPDNNDGTNDGSVFGYLNGNQFGTAGSAGNLRAAANNNAVGGINENARFHDNSTLSDGNNFNGLIDEMAHWHNTALSATQISAQAAEFIPEPSTLAMVALGLLSLTAWGWRRRKW
jgi:hypothetical protein